MKNLHLVALTALTLSFGSMTFAQTTATSVTVTTPATSVELNLGLEHMSLTAAQIRKRDKLLKPIYDNYQNVNLSSVANVIEKAYGSNVFHYMESGTLTLANKKSVMENAVRYYMGIRSLFDQADVNVIPLKGTVQLTNRSSGYYSDSSSANMTTVTGKLIQGNADKFEETTKFRSPSILASKVSGIQNDFLGIFDTSVSRALYTTSTSPLFSAPVMSEYLDAMKNLNLRGLDATINFVSDRLAGNKSYEVVYPHFSRIAPIPQPIIFISKDASYNDLVEMLETHAPRIFAYNRLFNASVLPSVKDINDLLTKYPNIMEEVRKVRGQVSRQNLVNAIQGAFLNLTYGVGAGVVGAAALLAAPVSIFVVASSPVLGPIFISNVIFFL
jgi:hypothetical protein